MTNQLDNLDDGVAQRTRKTKGSAGGEDEEELTFEQIYMRQITEALADELDDLKEREKIEEDESKITLLVDCLKGGMEFYDDLAKSLCVQGWKGRNDKKEGDMKGGLNAKGLHRRQQELY